MSRLDRDRARDAMERPSPLYERRVDPGTGRRENIDPPSKLAPPPPKTANPTNYGTVKR